MYQWLAVSRRVIGIGVLRISVITSMIFAATQTVEKLFDQKAAAHLLGVSVRTLERHRVAGTGPRFARLGRLVRYRKCDLADWVEKNSVGSTSEEPAATDRVRS
jgi:predicted DNA-binding transcriptional regulator AlpA